MSLPGYDRWKLASPYETRLPVGTEDYLGQRVVVGRNRWGLGRWGTVENVFVELGEDEDGKYDDVYFEVGFSDGELPTSETIDLYAVQAQLG